MKTASSGADPASSFDACLDGRVDVDVVALRLPVITIDAQAETRERSAQAGPVGHREARSVFRLGLDLVHRAPVLAVAPPCTSHSGYFVPWSRSSTGRLVHALRRRRSRTRHGCRRASRCASRCVGASAPGDPPPLELAHRREQLRQPPPDRASTADGARERVFRGLVGRRVLGELHQHSIALRARDVLRRLRPLGAAHRREQTPRADRSEAGGRIDDRPAAPRGRKRGGRRVAACRHVGADQRSHRGWQQLLERRERTVPLHGEVAPGQRRPPHQAGHDVSLQASRCQERRLHGQRLDLFARARVDVDVDHLAIRPRRLTGLGRRDLQRTARDRRGQQAKPPHSVVVGSPSRDS